MVNTLYCLAFSHVPRRELTEAVVTTIRFDFDSTRIRLAIDCNSTVLRLLDDLFTTAGLLHVRAACSEA